MNFKLRVGGLSFSFLIMSFSLVASGQVTSGSVISNVIGNSDGTFTYEYEVVNGEVFPIFQWSLAFDFDESLRDWNPLSVTAGGDVVTPLGDPLVFFDDWSAGSPAISLSSDSFIQDFSAVNPFGFGDVMSNENLSGFSFVSSLAPSDVMFTVFGPGGESSSGFVQGPTTVVPEPGALVLLGVFVGFVLRRGERR